MDPACKSEMTAKELHFLERVAPMGLDWTCPRETFRERFGVRSYFDWQDVICLPESTALSESPLQFMMHAVPSGMDLAPESLFADFLPTDDARENHREIERQLHATLGPPVIADTSNCLHRTWPFGVFAVELHTFPPELQRSFKNVLHERNPRLAFRSTVTLRSSYSYPYPDASLAAVGQLVRDLRSGAPPRSALFVDSSAALGWPPRTFPLRETRRNPMALSSALSPGDLVAWTEDPAGRIGLSSVGESLVFRKTPEVRLILLRLEPARGSGGSHLDVQTEPSKTRTMMLQGAGTESLDKIARQLSRLWKCAVVEESGLDD